VSFYNQSSGGSAIPPSPVVCCLGFLDDAAACVTPGLKGEEHALYLLGERLGEIGQSALSRTVLDHAGADVPRVRFDEERGMAAAVTDCVAAGLVEACHDISEGGLAVALAEMALLASRDSDLGLEVDLGAVGGAEVDAAQAARLLFCENGGYVLEISPAGEAGAAAVFARRNVRAFRLGTTARGGRMVIRGCGSAPLSFAVRDLREAWERGATEAMT
jgi:phosphoribosylformylglycinamidine (FGAM) synthase-like enzyme